MSGNLLNNDNITTTLFKKDNFKANTGLIGVGDGNASEKSIGNELYGANKLILNTNILAEDVSFNLVTSCEVGTLHNNPNYDSSIFNGEHPSGIGIDPTLKFQRFSDNINSTRLFKIL